MTLPAMTTDSRKGQPTRPAWTEEQVALITRTIARGATPDELQMFLHICQRTGLDPFARQIYAVKRWDKHAGREVMAVQTGIDGFRLVAERTGRYAPGRETTYDKATKEVLYSATAYVKKQTQDGTWHEVAETAHYQEYVQRGKDGAPTRFWRDMPHVMLGKVAEARALRRAFPQELSGLYTADEMSQATNGEEQGVDQAPHMPLSDPTPRESRADGITEKQAERLKMRAKAAGHGRDELLAWLGRRYGVTRLSEIRRSDYENIIARVDQTAPFADDAHPVDEYPGASEDDAAIPFE